MITIIGYIKVFWTLDFLLSHLWILFYNSLSSVSFKVNFVEKGANQNSTDGEENI